MSRFLNLKPSKQYSEEVRRDSSPPVFHKNIPHMFLYLFRTCILCHIKYIYIYSWIYIAVGLSLKQWNANVTNAPLMRSMLMNLAYLQTKSSVPSYQQKLAQLLAASFEVFMLLWKHKVFIKLNQLCSLQPAVSPPLLVFNFEIVQVLWDFMHYWPQLESAQPEKQV